MSESEQENEDSGGDHESVVATMNIYQRLREVRREVHQIDKAGKHGSGFRFVTHDDVTRALGGLYVKWGIDRTVSVREAKRDNNIIGMMVDVDWVNVDNPADRKGVSVYAEGVDIIRKNGDAQIDGLASGKGLSYAVKMAELKNFCLVGDSTSDSERASFNAPVSSEPVEAPSEDEYAELCKAYKACTTPEHNETFLGLRARLTPLVTQGKLTQNQMAELSKLDSDAKARVKPPTEAKK